MDESWLRGRKILVLEPRRIAARAAAERMAQTLSEPVGEQIGLRARMVSKSGPKTRVEIVTEGIFIGSCRSSQCCEPTAEERGAGNPHATFCGNRGQVTAPGDPVLAVKFRQPTHQTMRASKDGDGNATHVLSAFCAGLQSILGNEASRGKGMEIPDALKLLDRLDLKGRIVTGDAMFCQKSIVAKIVEKGGDYVLPVKDNQKNLRENIQTAFDEPVFSPGLV